MFDDPMEIVKTGKLTLTSGQLIERKITVNMSPCKWRRKNKIFFRTDAFLWHVNNKSNNNKKTNDGPKGSESKKNPSNIVLSDPIPPEIASCVDGY